MNGQLQTAWLEELRAGSEQMGLSLDDAQRNRLVAYLALLQKWNRTFNLTAIRDPGQMVSRQLFDSLSILPYLVGPRILDIGTGPGLPGIPLAVARPDFRFVLLDSNGKKTRFVQQAAAELGLSNVEVARCRVEDFHPGERFNSVTARAFTTLPRLISLTQPLLAIGGPLLAMKGKLPREEIDEISSPERTVDAISLGYPGAGGQRHLVIVRSVRRETPSC